jgi:hypothetical protein
LQPRQRLPILEHDGRRVTYLRRFGTRSRTRAISVAALRQRPDGLKVSEPAHERFPLWSDQWTSRIPGGKRNDERLPGRWWHRLDDGRIQCDLCPRDCRLHEGQRCALRAQARRRRDGP